RVGCVLPDRGRFTRFPAIRRRRSGLFRYSELATGYASRRWTQPSLQLFLGGRWFRRPLLTDSQFLALERQRHHDRRGGINMRDRLVRLTIRTSRIMAAASFVVGLAAQAAGAQEMKIIRTEAHIDALDPGIQLFVREKMQEGNTQFTNEKHRSVPAWRDRPVDLRFRSRL